MAMDLEFLDRNAAADDEVNWVTAIFMGLFHVGAIAALFFFTWKAFLVSMFLWWVSGSLGIGMGYHRLLTHRGYNTPKCGRIRFDHDGSHAGALEGGPIFWVATQPHPSPALPIRKVIHILPATVSGGRTWAGS